jgi:hypothetical protein
MVNRLPLREKLVIIWLYTGKECKSDHNMHQLLKAKCQQTVNPGYLFPLRRDCYRNGTLFKKRNGRGLAVSTYRADYLRGRTDRSDRGFIAVSVYHGSGRQNHRLPGILTAAGDVVAAYRAEEDFNPRRPEDLTQPAKLDGRPYLSQVPCCPVDGRPYDYNFLTGRFSCDKLEHRVIYD